MSLQTIVDTRIQLVVHKARGQFSPEDVRHQLMTTLKHPAFSPAMNVLWDFTQTGHVSLSTEELQMIARYTEEHVAMRGGSFKLALVAEGDLIFGLSRMYMAMMGDTPIKINVLRSVEAALNWLNSN